MSFLRIGNQTNTPAAAGTKDERPSAQFWLNIGLMLQVPDRTEGAAAGATVEEFISIPVGIPLDNIKAMVAKGKNPDWHNKVGVKNALLEELQTAASDLKPGQDVLVDALQIQLYRKAEEAAPRDPSENSLLAQMAEKLGG
ncbi:MAG: hypothetical protein JKY54_02235 [Flavobacteriales bacterium]|nr:hypothetical protein [Flavobacteriales bacterium]